jgi:Transposase, Mutator family
MARTRRRPSATIARLLAPLQTRCPACGGALWMAYHATRTVTTLEGLWQLRLKVRRCVNPACAGYHRPYRPEEEGSLVLPKGEFGLDVIALVGALRYTEHRSAPEIHQALQRRGVSIAERTVTYLLERYEELVALRLADQARLQDLLRDQGRVLLALDGLQPDVGHEVLWVLRDCLSGEVLLARSLLSATEDDLAALLREVHAALPVPITGVISDGQHSLRKAVQTALPAVPHQLCHFHYLREAAKPVYEADRHAKKELKKEVRGVRPIERALEERTDAQAEAIRGYCHAVRSALTDDGQPPLCASGLKLHDRLQSIAASIERVAERGDSHASCAASTPC